MLYQGNIFLEIIMYSDVGMIDYSRQPLPSKDSGTASGLRIPQGTVGSYSDLVSVNGFKVLMKPAA